jgi:hypothetical protein
VRRWFIDRRQEFIAASLRQFGQIRRADLIREFDVSVPQASADIALFMATKPAHVRYDVSAKAYVLEEDCPFTAPPQEKPDAHIRRTGILPNDRPNSEGKDDGQ